MATKSEPKTRRKRKTAPAKSRKTKPSPTPGLLDAALDYARQGMPVFPCKSDKTPFTKRGVIDATTDEKKIREWWDTWPKANIGCDVGSAGLMVLDFDPGHDMDELVDRVGKLPKTKLRQKTPRGGEHWFYEIKPDEIVSPSASKLAAKVDVRSFNSYVLLAPSTTKDGSYKWLERGKPAYRTDTLASEANSHRTKDENHDTWIIEPDLPENVADAVTWLKSEAKIATEGQGGDHCAYATAAMMKSYGISKELAFDLMWEHWNPRCNPPWDSSEADHLETKIKNGYSYNTSPPGNCTQAYHIACTKDLFKPVSAPVDPDGDAPPIPEGLFNVDGLATRPVPPFSVEGVKVAGKYSIASGRSQAGKSFSEMALALSLATSVPWLGLEIYQPAHVLWIAAEGQDRIDHDVEAWCREFKVDRATLHDRFFMFERSARLNTDDGKRKLSELLGYVGWHAARSDEPVEVWFDTLKRNMRGGVSQEEPTSDVLATVNDLSANGYGVNLIAHHGRGHGETKGLTEWEDDADFVRHYTGTVRDRSTQIKFSKVKRGEDGWSLAVEYAEHQLSEDASTLVAAHGKRVEETTASTVKGDQADLTPLVDAAVLRFLSGNALAKYSNDALAKAVACDDELKGIVGASGSSIRQKYLPLLRENHSDCGHCYDPRTSRWRYVEPEARHAEMFKVIDGGRSGRKRKARKG